MKIYQFSVYSFDDLVEDSLFDSLESVKEYQKLFYPRDYGESHECFERELNNPNYCKEITL